MKRKKVSVMVAVNAYSALSSDQNILTTHQLNQKYKQTNKSARFGTVARYKKHLK